MNSPQLIDYLISHSNMHFFCSKIQQDYKQQSSIILSCQLAKPNTIHINY